MDVLLGVDFAVAEKDRLYRCLDRILEHRQELFRHLQQRWATLFDVEFDVLLYDLTSTYFEGAAEVNPKAKRGYSRDGRPDCLQVVVALVVTPEGFPLAYEVMDGQHFGQDHAARISEEDRRSLRAGAAGLGDGPGHSDRGGAGGDARRGGRRSTWWARRAGGWPSTRSSGSTCRGSKVRDSVEVKLFSQDGELYVLAKSEGRQAKEIAMRRKKLARLLWKLRAMRRSCPKRDQLLHARGRGQNRSGPGIRIREDSDCRWLASR